MRVQDVGHLKSRHCAVGTVAFVIPALNEAEHLPRLLSDLREVDLPLDVTVVDGGSSDDTIGVAQGAGARVITAPRGRARQMNAGARECDTDWLCFLHADVRMPKEARRDLERAVRRPTAPAAAWRLAVDGPGAWLRLMEFGAWMRDRVCGLPYGDQGLLVRRHVFERLGGFPDVPVLEDAAFVRALKRHVRLARLPSRIVVSDRRWRKEGRYLTTLRNAALLAAFALGVPPHRLAHWYRPHRA